MTLVAYGITGLGLFGLALSSKIGAGIIGSELAKALLIPSLTLTVAGVVILLVVSKKGFGTNETKKNKETEVPIYKGKEVVGYRVVE